jgi:hypothetical protein
MSCTTHRACAPSVRWCSGPWSDSGQDADGSTRGLTSRSRLTFPVCHAREMRLTVNLLFRADAVAAAPSRVAGQHCSDKKDTTSQQPAVRPPAQRGRRGAFLIKQLFGVSRSGMVVDRGAEKASPATPPDQ